jgi:hypothetical protein
MRHSLLAAAAVGVGAVLAFTGLGLAAGQKDAFNLTANLKARFEVPKPTDVPAAAVGAFKGKAIELENDRVRLTWRLTFSHLSGRAVAAHIHVGRRGKAGNVMVPLCGPCKSGQKGTATITHAQLRTIRAGRAYVNIHTPKNPAGEIRGQVKASEAVPVVGPPPPPSPQPPPPPPPPPYP